MERLASLPKPPGVRPRRFRRRPRRHLPPPPARRVSRSRPGPPANQYGSTNSDLAFSGNHLFVGNYNGINFYDIDNPAKIKLRTSLVCPGGQGDVSVYGHLLFMSAEAVNGRIDCGTQGIPLPEGYVPPPPPPPPPPAAPGASPHACGARLRRPARTGSAACASSISATCRIRKQVAAVQSCRGSHTHTLVIDPKDKDNVYIYISGTGAVRQAGGTGGLLGRRSRRPIRTQRCSGSTSSRCRWRTRSRRRS